MQQVVHHVAWHANRRAASLTALDDALALPALTVDGSDLSVADVAVAALHLSEWSGVERRAREVARCLADAELGPREEEVRAAAAAFRRERRLLSAEEMEAWLARRALSAGVWMRWVRGDLARRGAAPGEAGGAADEPAVAFSASELWAEAICSGALQRAARRLAELLVAPEPTVEGASQEGPRAPDPEALRALAVDRRRARELLGELALREAALERLARRVATPQAIEQQLRSHQTDWLCVDFRALALSQETVAREVMLCVRDDGMALEEVAPLAGGAVKHERALLADTPAGLQEHLLSATPGELVGPLERDGRLAVLVVDAKQSPSLEDPEVGRRARRELLERVLESEITARVRWHERL